MRGRSGSEMIPERVRKVLDEHGLEAVEFEPGSTPTAPLAAEKLGVAVGQIAKSLLFRGKDGVYRMVVCAGDRRVSNAKLKALTGVKMRMATPEETLEATGLTAGGVCPFGVTGIVILVDISLERFDVVYPAAGTDASGVPSTAAQLLSITGGERCDVTQD